MRRNIQSFLAAFFLLPLLSACSPTPDPVSKPVTLTLVIVPFPSLSDRSAEFERLVKAFQETNPHIDVQVKSVNFEDLPQGLANADFLTNPEWSADVIMTNSVLFPELAERGLLHDLEPVLEANSALGAEDFYRPTLDTLRLQGHLYGLPAELDPWVMFYNQDLFDTAEIPYPSGDWGWDSFLGTLQALKRPGIFPFGSWGVQVIPFVYQNGGMVVDDPMAPEKATLDDPATVEAVRWYVDLASLEGVMPTPSGLAQYATGQSRRMTIVTDGDPASKVASQARADLEQAVSAGDVAMWMGKLSEGGGHRKHWDFRWGVTALPTGRQTATLANVQGYFITAHSEHFEQALQWVDYLTRQPALYSGLPARRSVATDDAFRNQLRPEIVAGLDACLRVLEDGVILPESVDWMAVQWLQGPLFAVLAGELTVEEALAMAQQQAEEVFRQK